MKAISEVSTILGEEILFSIYPVLIEKISNGEIYLGQGGKQFKKGQQYEVFEKGEKIIDSYTNEVIGSVETSVSKIEISSVSSGYSKAKFLDQEIKFCGSQCSKNSLDNALITAPEKRDDNLLKKLDIILERLNKK